MTTKLIILTVLGAVVLAALAYMIVRAWRYRRNHPDEDPGASRHQLPILLLLLLLAPAGAWAQNTWTVTNPSGSTFTVSRSNTSIAETVIYRTVNLSAYAGIHYVAKSDTLIFAAGIPSRTVTVSELTPSNNNAYKYQNTTSRSYRFEVTDQGGFYLAHCTRSNSSGTSVTSSGVFDVKDVTIQSAEYTADDDGYDVNGYKSVGASSYCTSGTQAYLTFLGVQLRMTLSFEAKENDDAYEYLQLLVDNTSTCDNRSGCSNGDPGNISLSRYMAGFEMNTGSKDDTYRSYTFPVTSVGNNAGATNPWGYGTTHPLTMQKFNTNCRATDGRLIIPTTFNTLVLRLNASGSSGSDEWAARYVKAHIQAVDATAPTKLDVSVAPGKHAKGDTVYVSVAFSEIVTVTGSPYLTTTNDNQWGTLSYYAGSGSNVLTFRGIIPDAATGSLNVTGLSGTVKDLAGNSVSGGVTANNLCSLDASYAWPITYDLAGGSVATPNPATYTWSTATFTLTNPTREGYTFAGWTGSNGNTPQTSVTIALHTHVPLSYTANWTPTVYNITYNLGGGTASNPDTYTIETADFTLTTPTREGYTFLGWTGTGLDAATQTVTIAQGSTGDRSYTANWNNLWGVDADHDGTTAERAYVITTPEGLNHLATLVNGGNGFSGTFFKLGADIAYSCTSQWNDAESTESNYTPIGNYNSSRCPFRGTFDGCGHSVSGIRINASNDYKGLFGYIYGGTVRNVTLSDSRITGCQDVGGIVGENYHGTVENCHATATVAIYSRTNGTPPNYHGGIVGYNDGTNANATVVGCTSAATVSGTENNYGGVVGWNYNATVSRCLALGAVVTAGSSSDPVVGGSNNNNVTDCRYRRCTVGGNARNDLYAIVAGTGVTLAPSGAATVAYPHGGLQLYGSAILYGDTLYAPAGATVSLDLINSVSGGQLGYTYDGFAASAGTLDGSANPYTLTLPSQDVTISATNLVDQWGIADGADGTSAHPYVITTPEGLLLLSAETNGGNGFDGKYFKLGADIDMSGVANFRPINNFSGIFDGCRHTISHLTANWPDGFSIGLFGHLNGTVQNVTLSDASVTGSNNVGAIASDNHGTIGNCVVLNTTVTGTSEYTYVGAIVDYVRNPENLTRNYYHNCTVVRDGVSYTSNIGTNDGDVNESEMHKAVKGDLFTLDVAAGQWQAIASPLSNNGYEQYLALTDLATGNYDLFGYDEYDATWENMNDNFPYYLDRGDGYIYRSATGGTRTFVGLPNSESSHGINLYYRCSNEALKGFNLVGNPYNQPIAFSDISVAAGYGAIAPGYYTLDGDGTWQAHTAGTIAPGQGFLLQATEPRSGQDYARIQINRPAKGAQASSLQAESGKRKTESLAFTVKGNGHEDVAYALFAEGEGLRKMAHLDAEAPNLSIPQDAQRYAIATLSDSTQAFPLALQATAGEYELKAESGKLKAQGVSYLHLIDRVTGADIDLLHDSTYTFTHSNNNAIAARFLVKLSPSGAQASLPAAFAHLEGDRLVIEGSGTLEAYDIMGRKLFAREMNTNTLTYLNINAFPSAGVYILRLGSQSQKIVITK